MSESRKGFVAMEPHRNESKPNAKRPWFGYSFKLVDEDGNEDPTWYQLGFNVDCPFKKDDYVSFDCEPNSSASGFFSERA